jgi:general secretion pathway protein L
MVLLAVGNGVSYLVKERIQLEQIEERIARLQPQVLEVEKAGRRYRQLRERKKNLETISRQPASLLAVLKELTIKLPSDVWLERFKMSKKEIEIAGFAKAASSLIPVLEDSPLFKDVKFTSTITSKGGGRERFKLKITLER